MELKPRVRASKARDVKRSLEAGFLPGTKSETKKLIEDVKRFKSEHDRLLSLHERVHYKDIDAESIKQEITELAQMIDAAEPKHMQRAKKFFKAAIGKREPENWTRAVLIKRRNRLYMDLNNVFDIERSSEEEREQAIKAMRATKHLLEGYLSQLGTHLRGLKH